MRKTLVKCALAASTLFVFATLMASSSTVKCTGKAIDQYGDGINKVTVYCVQDPSISTSTDSRGNYSLMGIPQSSQVNATPPSGYSSTSDQTSDPLSSSENVVNFEFHDDMN